MLEPDSQGETSVAPSQFQIDTFKLTFNPKETLPPDNVAKLMGFEAGAVINTRRVLLENPLAEMGILDLGVGTGIHLVSAAMRIQELDNVSLRGVDIDTRAIATAQQNLDRLIQSLSLPHKPNLDLKVGDWLNVDFWRTLSQKFDVILFNPPYLPTGEKVRDGYSEVPEQTMYGPDSDGLGHYRAVLPHLPALLKDEEGATILVRYPNFLNSPSSRNDSIQGLLQELLYSMTTQSLGVTSGGIPVLNPIGDNRDYSVASFTRGERYHFIHPEDLTKLLPGIKKYGRII